MSDTARREKAIKDLQRHAREFLNGGLWSYTGYFPDDFYGKEGHRYYEWSKRAYDLIRALDDQAPPGVT